MKRSQGHRAQDLYSPALALSEATASVGYFETRVIQHAMLVRAAKNPKALHDRLISLREFCERLREARATKRRCQKVLDKAVARARA